MATFPNDEPDFDFFFTSDDLYLLAKGLNHLVDCECTTIQELVDCFPLLSKIEKLNAADGTGLEHLAESWGDKTIDEPTDV